MPIDYSALIEADNMKTIVDYLDEYAALLECDTDTALAKALVVTKQAVSKYRRAESAPGLNGCWKIAEALGIRPEFVIAAAEAERARISGNEPRLAQWLGRLEKLHQQFPTN